VELRRKAYGPRSRATSSAAFIDGAVIAWSKKPSDVWQVLSFLAIYIAAVTDMRSRQRRLSPDRGGSTVERQSSAPSSVACSTSDIPA
jgi:hypothetical protein